MNARTSLHPTDQTLNSYGLGKLDDGSAAAVNKHLEQCPDCRQRVAEMSADSFLERMRGAQKRGGDSTFGESRPGSSQSNQAVSVPSPPPASTLPHGLADHPDYEIMRELGRGGMGVVYLAHNTLMDRDEVLKIMGRHIMERPGVLDRFLREIRAVAQLRHPNIVTAYHATRIGDSIVFAMEYVPGLDLSRMVRSRGPMPIAHACYFAHQAALGLEHAHEKGLVHRDIKPGNLMLSHRKDKATIKILDFGLARATREEKVDVRLTSEGQALGTPDYIAPEQIVDALNSDIRADIYSLGGTLYHLLTGRPPFQAGSLYDIYQAHMSRDAELLNLVRPEVPTGLAALVAKMMAKDPARRFQTPGEVAHALAPFFKQGSAAFETPKAVASPKRLSPLAQPMTNAVSMSSGPPTGAGGLTARSTTGPEPAVPEARWESLIEFRDRERSTQATPAVSPVRRLRQLSWPIAIAASLFSLIAFGIIMITIKHKNGEPEISAKYDTKGGSGASTTPAITPKTLTEKSTAAPSPEPATSITNSIGMTFALIPQGEFMMGSDASDPYAEYSDEFLDAQSGKKEKHRVPITKAFYMGIHEVTRGQFRRFVAEAGYQTEAEKDGSGGWGWNEQANQTEQDPRYTWWNSGFKQTDEHPVVNVSWNDAQEFINWLSRKEGKVYRLPTEAEWEYACRAGSAARSPFIDNPDGLAAVGNVADATGKEKFPDWTWAVAAHDGFVFTAPVGRFDPNAWGLFDMYGNVWEWCWDGYAADYYRKSPMEDPQGVDGASDRMSRGGGWSSGPGHCRSAERGRFAQAYRFNHLGFRLARNMADKK
jgi:formylglycine-generating enzyme required for sulfatase activity